LLARVAASAKELFDSQISGNRIELLNYDRVDRDTVNLAVGLARLFRITGNQDRYVRVLPRLVADAIGQFL
jgi:lipopolysaccharide biosynthesis regulator YciM